MSINRANCGYRGYTEDKRSLFLVKTPCPLCYALLRFPDLKRKAPLHRNLDKCPHCGKSLVRFNETTAIVNRTDGKTFHIGLFSGPYRREVASRDLHFDQAICNFVYISNQVGTAPEYFVLAILHANATEDGLRRQMEAAADKLAVLVAQGNKLGSSYTFRADRLVEGLPT